MPGRRPLKVYLPPSGLSFFLDFWPSWPRETLQAIGGFLPPPPRGKEGPLRPISFLKRAPLRTMPAKLLWELKKADRLQEVEAGRRGAQVPDGRGRRKPPQ